MSKLFSFVEKLRNHKNWVVIIISILLIGFIDSNSIWDRHFRWQRIDELKSDIANLESEFDKDTKELNDLRSNPRKVVKIARERYLMTRPGEDLFLIKPENEVSDATHVKETNDTDGDPQV